MKYPYSYTVLRYIHDVSTGEFLNIGVVLYSARGGAVKSKFLSTYARLHAAFPDMNGAAMRHQIHRLENAFESMAKRFSPTQDLLESPPADVMSIVHEILPPTDTSFQWSPASGGLAVDLDRALEKLFRAMVPATHENAATRRQSDKALWNRFERKLKAHNVADQLDAVTIEGPQLKVTFEHAFQNGIYHCVQPLSLDFAEPADMQEKACAWLGKTTSIQSKRDDFKLYVLVGAPRRNNVLNDRYREAVGILSTMPVEKRIVLEEDMDAFAAEFAGKIQENGRGEAKLFI